MLTRPLSLNDSDDRGHGLVAVTPHPTLQLADEGDDDDTKTRVFSPPAISWSSTSSSTPPCASPASLVTPSSSLSSVCLTHPPAPPTAPSLLSACSPTLPVPLQSSSSSACPSPHVAPSIFSSSSSSSSSLHTSSVPFPSCTPPTSHFSPLSSSTLLVLPTIFSQAAPSLTPPCVSSTQSILSSPHLAPSSRPPPLPSSFSTPSFSTIPAPLSVSSPGSSLFLSSTSTSPPTPPCFLPSTSSLHAPLCAPTFATPSSLSSLLASSHILSPLHPSPSSKPPLSTIPAPLSVSSSHFSYFLPPSSSSPPVPPSLHSSPPPSLSPRSFCTPLPVSLVPSCVTSSPVLPPSSHDSPSLSSTPLPSVHCHSSLSSVCPPLLSSPPTVPPPSPPPCSSSHPPAAPSPAPTPRCACYSLLPRLLSAHRLEVRRLLRGAVASLSRRLDSLERRSRRKTKKRGSRQKGEEGARAVCSSGSVVFRSTSSCNPTHPPPVTSSSSSSDNEDSARKTLSSSVSHSDKRRRRRCKEEEEKEEGEVHRKRRRKNHRRREMSILPENRADEEEEQDAGRFVGRMVVSFTGGPEKKDATLTLRNFNEKKNKGREGEENGQSEKALSVVRQNGFRAPLLHNLSSQNSLHILQSSHGDQACSQSEALPLSSGQWHFSDFTPPLNLSSNHGAFHMWLCSSSSSSSCRSALMMRLSAVAVKTLSESMRGGACGGPLRPLKDWTAPPSLSSDHCYMRTPSPSPTFPARRQLKQRANHSSLQLPRRRPLPPPSCSTNGISVLLPTSQSAADPEFLNTKGERGKRVSQIRIRRAPPRETPLTPMGLPKVKRLKKKEFSLEEIYTNKNYKSPTTNRSLETIFEEPREKDGALLLIGHQRRRRLLLFPDFTQPRKRKRPQGAGLPVVTMPRKRSTARRCNGGSPADDESDLDVMLVERLSALEDFLTRQGLDV